MLCSYSEWMLKSELSNSSLRYSMMINATSSLREKPDVLAKLREKLFCLWGDLEEQKIARLEKEKSVLQETDTNGSAQITIGTGADGEPKEEIQELSSKPFEACIKEYGVHFPPSLCMQSDACSSESCAEMEHWTRRFRLFDVKINQLNDD